MIRVAKVLSRPRELLLSYSYCGSQESSCHFSLNFLIKESWAFPNSHLPFGTLHFYSTQPLTAAFVTAALT